MQKFAINTIGDVDKIPKCKFDVVIVSLPIHKEDILNAYCENGRLSEQRSGLSYVLERAYDSVSEEGLLYVYGSPVQLVKAFESLRGRVKFRYWIAIDVNSMNVLKANDLNKVHLGILMMSKGKGYLSLNTDKVRIEHLGCTACNMNLRDWGGKKHLMNKEGAGISDVWRDFFPVIKRIQDKSRPDIRLKLVESTRQSFSFEANDIAKPILDRLTNLVRRRGRKLAGIRVGGLIVPKQTESRTSSSEPRFVSPPLSAINKVELGDAIQVMEKLVKQYPQGVFDLVFADPPYNLQKDYKLYDDDLQAEEYLSWCDKWLELCVRLTKPKGNLFVLNIPKWAVFHAQTLMKSSYFQNWIVWDALSTPKGKIMPAHYALLHFAKSSARFTYNRPEAVDASEYCLRSSCLRSRKKALTSAFTESASIFGKTVQVSDIWWDIPRIKHRKHRDDHPCQLPDKLMDRIIQCFSNTNDLVFDPFAGAGTTALRALANGRSFFTIELDPSYHKITSTKLAQLETRGSITRQPSTHRLKSKYTKKDLELKVQSLAHSLGRAPSMQELLAEYQLELSLIESLYGDPKRVLKAARISLLNGRTN